MRNATPKQRKEIALQRAAGCSLAQISVKTGFSVSTIQRICKNNSTKKGEIQKELIEKAKQDLLDENFGDQALQDALKMQIVDVLAHATLAKEKLALVLDGIEVDSNLSSYQAMRAIAAHSTALKNYSDATRHLLPDFEIAVEPEEYVVRVITDEEVAELRAEQERQDKEWFGEKTTKTEEC